MTTIQQACLAAAALAFAAASGCSDRSASANARMPRPELMHVEPWSPPDLDTSSWELDAECFESEEEAVKAVLDALNRKSIEGLARITVNRREYVEYVYPFSPVSAPVRNTPAGFVWEHHWIKAAAGMKRALVNEGGKDLVYSGHEFSGRPETLGPLKLLRDVRVKVVSRDTTREIRPFRSLVSLHGRYKVFSYLH